ncbi:ankyrin repeat-containing domain protein [Gloeopeniophorella convolvens]|nr:ankyrin repeat-containing domain protein [Gloeopeniophorella convolvens]
MSATGASSAASYHSLFTEALKNYKNKTGQDPTAHALVAQLSRCTSPEEVTALLQKETEKQDETHKSRWRTRMLEKVTPIIGVIRPLCDTAGKAAGLAFGPSETIFGVIGILLTIPDNYTKNHEALIQLLEQIAHFLGRLGTFVVPEDLPSDDAMTKIIMDILVELIRIFALLTQRARTSDTFLRKFLALSGHVTQLNASSAKAKRGFKKVLAIVSGDNEIESMLKRLDDLTKVEHLMATAQARRDIAIVKREQRRQERMQQEQRYRTWLSVPNSSTNQVTASEARYSDTSMWLVRGKVYEAWKSSGTLLWIIGKPGAGKTVICSTVIQNLDLLRSNSSSAALAYFYCDFRDTTKQSYRSLLVSLLIDLSTQSDESENILRELFSRHKDGSQEPEIGVLKKCLEEMLVQSDDTKYIVIDALDEMPNYGISSSREETLELMSWLIGLRLSGLRLCVTSRPEDDIGQVLKPLASHQVALDEEGEHREDIARLIRSIVEKNRKMQGWGDTIKEEVIEALSEKADGMFRYVSCQLDILCEAPMSKIRSTLRSLPTTLYTTYESTLERISEEKWEDAHRLFQCLSFSTRPLFVEELAEVLAVSIDEEVPTYHNDWRSNDPESVVLSTCSGSFIQVVDEEDLQRRRIVQFAHFSVKEFLTSDQLATSQSKISRFHVLPESSHIVLAKACLGILLQSNAAVSTSTQLRLETYATHSWDTHARFEDVSTSLLKAMKLLFDPSKPHFEAWARRRVEGTRLRYNGKGNPLYFAASCGLLPIVEHILASGSYDINARGGYHATALFAALMEGRSLAVIRSLLDGGADVNIKGNLGEGTALQVAVSRGNRDIVQLLLDHGANIHAPSLRSGSTLQDAVSDGNRDIVQLLLDRGADVNELRGSYGSALERAVSNGNLDVVQVLLDHGADANVNGSTYKGGALQKAVSNGNLDIVRLLLNHGADVNIKGGVYGDDVLREAASKGNRDIVQLLLDHGADVNAPGGSALQRAASNDNLNIVELLLNHGADVNATGGTYEGSALLEAASKGNRDIVKLLLDRGADINAPGGRYGSALQGAVSNGNLDIVQLLLDRGADINAKGDYCRSALQEAASNGNLDIFQLLLDRGADVNIPGSYHGNALQEAASNGHLDIVQLLLDRGADVNELRGSYGSALERQRQKAIAILFSCCLIAVPTSTPRPAIMVLLLNHGASVNEANGGPYEGSALQEAASKGDLDIVQLLINYGANVNAPGHRRSVLQEAVSNGNLDIIQLLLNHGADVNVEGGLYEGSALQEAVSEGKLNIVELLLNHGAGVNAEGGLYDGSALQEAVSKRNPEIIQLLLDHGADVNAPGGRYGSALQEVASNGNLEIVLLLLDHGANANAPGGEYHGTLLDRGADVNAPDDFHGSVLQKAVSNGRLDIVQLLLNHGADVNVKGGTLQEAASKGNRDIVLLLLDHGADVNAKGGLYGGSALQEAASNGNLDIIQLLLDHGADVNVPGGHYGSALQGAASNGKLDIVQLLLDRGADVNTPGGFYGSALQVAASRNGALELVQLLVDHGADINVQGGFYGNMLQAAACNWRGETDTVRFFLDRGFDVNAQGGEFGTALIGASYAGNLDIVRLLLACGADTSIRSKEYGTAMEAAQACVDQVMDDQNHTAIVELLSSAPQDSTCASSTQ